MDTNPYNNEYFHSQSGNTDGLGDLPLGCQCLVNLSLSLLLAPVGFFFIVLGFKLLF